MFFKKNSKLKYFVLCCKKKTANNSFSAIHEVHQLEDLEGELEQLSIDGRLVAIHSTATVKRFQNRKVLKFVIGSQNTKIQFSIWGIKINKFEQLNPMLGNHNLKNKLRKTYKIYISFLLISKFH